MLMRGCMALSVSAAVNRRLVEGERMQSSRSPTVAHTNGHACRPPSSPCEIANDGLVLRKRLDELGAIAEPHVRIVESR